MDGQSLAGGAKAMHNLPPQKTVENAQRFVAPRLTNSSTTGLAGPRASFDFPATRRRPGHEDIEQTQKVEPPGRDANAR
jgi:hypothetical protein